MIQQHPFLLLTLIVSIHCCLLSAALPESSESPNIQADRLAAHVAFLSDDLLEGRGTGTRGYDLAALYVATEFRKLGLSPIDGTGSYFQPVPFRKADLVPDECRMSVIDREHNRDLTYGEHFLPLRDYNRARSSVKAEVVFAGFGITAPDQNYDDYSGIQVDNKVVILLSGAPAKFPISERAHYSSSRLKEENAAAHGAIGILFLRTPVDQQRYPWERALRDTKMSAYHRLEADGAPAHVIPQLEAMASISNTGAEAIFQSSGKKLDEVFRSAEEGKAMTFALPVQVELTVASSHEAAESPNVVGMLEGSDPSLRSQVVVITAHLDHKGTAAPGQGDVIYNGAYDNASGIAALLEIARAFAELPEKPSRSVLFVAVTGEEQGLQGSEHFATHPTVARDSIVADINMDMILLLYPLADAVAMGAEHSSLGPIAQEALRKSGLEMTPDPLPEEVRFIRSDQYSFIREGIPSIRIMSGNRSTDKSVNGEEAIKNWMRTIYHSPQDDNSQKIDWESGVKITRANFLIGLAVANAPERPRWNEGDFFGRTFAQK